MLKIFFEKMLQKNLTFSYSNDGTLNCISTNLFGNMFDFIRWEDKEPWCIEDLKKLEVKG